MTDFEATHLVTFYGGNAERVRIVADRTNVDYGFMYGAMEIECESGKRTIHFGRTNAIAIRAIDDPGSPMTGMQFHDPDTTDPEDPAFVAFARWVLRTYGEHELRQYMGARWVARHGRTLWI